MELTEAFNRWEAVCQRSPVTKKNYKYALSRFAAAGIVRVEDATPEKIGAYVADFLQHARAQTVLVDIAALCSIVRHLVRLGLASREHLHTLRDLRPCVPKRRALHARFLTRAEFESLRTAARKQRRQKDEAEGVVVLAVLAGLRAGELAKLLWEDVDLVRRVIRVRHDDELYDKTAGARGATKTGRERLVPIVDELRAFLAPLHRGQGYVFVHGPRASVNAVATVATLRGRLKRAAARAGVKGITFHLTRHTRASWWWGAKIAVAKPCKWLGHSIQTASRFYVGLLDGYDSDAEQSAA